MNYFNIAVDASTQKRALQSLTLFWNTVGPVGSTFVGLVSYSWSHVLAGFSA